MRSPVTCEQLAFPLLTTVLLLIIYWLPIRQTPLKVKIIRSTVVITRTLTWGHHNLKESNNHRKKGTIVYWVLTTPLYSWGRNVKKKNNNKLLVKLAQYNVSTSVFWNQRSKINLSSEKLSLSPSSSSYLSFSLLHRTVFSTIWKRHGTYLIFLMNYEVHDSFLSSSKISFLCLLLTHWTNATPSSHPTTMLKDGGNIEELLTIITISFSLLLSEKSFYKVYYLALSTTLWYKSCYLIRGKQGEG